MEGDSESTASGGERQPQEPISGHCDKVSGAHLPCSDATPPSEDVTRDTRQDTAHTVYARRPYSAEFVDSQGWHPAISGEDYGGLIRNRSDGGDAKTSKKPNDALYIGTGSIRCNLQKLDTGILHFPAVHTSLSPLPEISINSDTSPQGGEGGGRRSTCSAPAMTPPDAPIRPK